MAVAPKHDASHHHRMIEHHARELRKMAGSHGLTKKTEAKGGRDAAKVEKRKPRGEFAGKRK